MLRRTLVLVPVLVLALAAGTLAAPMEPLVLGWEQFFRLDWSSGERGGRPVVYGHVVNEWGMPARGVRRVLGRPDLRAGFGGAAAGGAPGAPLEFDAFVRALGATSGESRNAVARARERCSPDASRRSPSSPRSGSGDADSQSSSSGRSCCIMRDDRVRPRVSSTTALLTSPRSCTPRESASSSSPWARTEPSSTTPRVHAPSRRWPPEQWSTPPAPGTASPRPLPSHSPRANPSTLQRSSLLAPVPTPSRSQR